VACPKREGFKRRAGATVTILSKEAALTGVQGCFTGNLRGRIAGTGVSGWFREHSARGLRIPSRITAYNGFVNEAWPLGWVLWVSRNIESKK